MFFLSLSLLVWSHERICLARGVHIIIRRRVQRATRAYLYGLLPSALGNLRARRDSSLSLLLSRYKKKNNKKWELTDSCEIYVYVELFFFFVHGAINLCIRYNESGFACKYTCLRMLRAMCERMYLYSLRCKCVIISLTMHYRWIFFFYILFCFVLNECASLRNRSAYKRVIVSSM